MPGSAGSSALPRTAALFPTAERCCCRWSVDVKFAERVQMGRDVIIGPGCTVGAAGTIRLGDDVRLSRGAILDRMQPGCTVPPPYPHIQKPIVIGAGVSDRGQCHGPGRRHGRARRGDRGRRRRVQGRAGSRDRDRSTSPGFGRDRMLQRRTMAPQQSEADP